jgi:ribonuclease VapC
LDAIKKSPWNAIGAPTLVESLIVLTARLGGDPLPAVKELLLALGTDVIPFTEDHTYLALKAYLKYGKGRHPAALNYGDCMSYAIATLAREPLLYLGGDFAKTDLKQA